MSTLIEPLMNRAAGRDLSQCEAAAPKAGLLLAEELANSLTHGLGLVLSIAGLYVQVRVTASSSSIRHPVGCMIFSASLIVLYSASTLYHSWPQNAAKRVLLLVDHIAIYLLIAGTYTPIALIALRGSVGWALLAVSWGSALIGSLAKVARIDQLDSDSPWPYVALGWMSLAVLDGLAATVPAVGILWLVAGGFFYTAGLVFFVRHDRRFNHTIWHLFVLAGSVCHYRAVLEHLA
jgi:hemolysin III